MAHLLHFYSFLLTSLFLFCLSFRLFFFLLNQLRKRVLLIDFFQVKSRELLQCFHWYSAPPAQTVAQHLLRLGSFFTPANPVSNITAKQNLAIIIPKV
jgi:hypothetical protein